MSWRTVVISKRAKLDYQLGYLVVRSEETTKIHLGEISTILVESTAVSLTTCLLAELAKKKIKVIFCDEKHNRPRSWSAIMAAMTPATRCAGRFSGVIK